MPASIYPHKTYSARRYRRPAPRPTPFRNESTSKNHATSRSQATSGNRPAPTPGKWLRRLHWYDEIKIAELNAYYNTPNVHLPTWRLRFAIAVRLFPILWVLPKCSAPKCQDHWPCKPLLKYLRQQHGWTGSIDQHVKALSTKRNRRKATARNPTAVTHRAQ